MKRFSRLSMFGFFRSEEETSGDEAEEHGSGEEQDDGGEEKPLDQNKTTQFQKL